MQIIISNINIISRKKPEICFFKICPRKFILYQLQKLLHPKINERLLQKAMFKCSTFCVGISSIHILLMRKVFFVARK